MIGAIDKHRKALLALALAVAFVAIAIPSCRMIGCSMGGAMPWGHNAAGLGIYGTCGGTWVTNAAPIALVPPTTYTLILAMFAAFVAALALSRPTVLVERIRVHDSDPPPPPEDPRGERLRI